MSILGVQRVPYSVAGFGGRLTQDFASRAAAAEPFFGRQKWRDVVEKISGRQYPRAALCDALEQRARRLAAPAPVFESIAKLREPHTFAVLTGQQAGLLGGPLLTLHKALTAIKLAQQYEREAGGQARFVPVFWVAADDHDLAEIDHAWLLDEEGELHRVQAGAYPESLGASAARIRLDVEHGAGGPLHAQLEAAGLAGEVAQTIEKMYAAEPIADVFARHMQEWLGEMGLIVAHSTDIRPLAGDVLLRDLECHAETTRSIAAAAERMKGSGYTPGFSRPNPGPHFFIETSGGVRAALVYDEAAQTYRERSAAFKLRQLQPRTYTRPELADLIRREPERFSASAALRPVVQQAVFPVAAVTLGPGEIAYWAQLKGVHEQFGVPWPAILPRATMTLIDGAGEKLIRKLGLQDRPADLFQDAQTLKRRLLPDADTAARLRERRMRILAELDAIVAEAGSAALGLERMLVKIRRRFTHELGRIERRLGEAVAGQAGVGERRIEYLHALIRPRNAPQERVLCTAGFMLRFPQLPQDLLEAIDPGRLEHMVVTLA